MRCLVALFVASSVLFMAGPADAQTPRELRRARDTFRQGVQLTRLERWDEAVERFREVIAVRDTVPVRYNLALALAHTEAILEAAEMLDALLLDPEIDDATRDLATEVLERLEPQLSRLTITVPADPDSDQRVWLDGEELEPDRLGQPIRLLAGEHRVVLREGEDEVLTRTLALEAGGAESVSLVREVPLPTPVPEEEPLPQSDEDVASQWWFWTIIAVGAAAIGAGVVIGVTISSDGTVQPLSGNLDPGLLTVAL